MLVCGLADDYCQELLAGTVADEALTILGEGAGVKRRLIEVHVQKPPKQEVLLELLAKLPIAAH